MRVEFKNVFVSNTILDIVKDGVDIINLNDNKTELAKKLNPYIKRTKPFKFLNFEIFSLGRFMLYLSHKDFPIANFTKPYYSKVEKLTKRNFDNYWGIISLYLIDLVKSDKALYKMLKENTLPFNAYQDVKDGTNHGTMLLGKPLAVKSKVNKLHGYCRCVEYVSNLVKNNDIYNDVEIKDILIADFPGIEDSVMALVEEIQNTLLKQQPVNHTTKKFKKKKVKVETTVEVIDTKSTDNNDIKTSVDAKSPSTVDISKLYNEDNK